MGVSIVMSYCVSKRISHRGDPKNYPGQLGAALSSPIPAPKKRINNAIVLMIMDGNCIYPSGEGYLSARLL